MPKKRGTGVKPKKEKKVKAVKVDTILYETEAEVHSALIEVLVFLIFLISCTVIALNTHNVYGFHSNNGIKRYFALPYSTTQFIWQVERISSLERWWDYVGNILVPGIYTTLELHDDIVMDPEKDPYGLHSRPAYGDVNILLHPIRLRQVRIKPSKCLNQLNLSSYPDECYGAYNPSIQEHAPEFKGTKYVDSSKTDMKPVWATYETYSPGEYIEHIPETGYRAYLANLKDIGWVDRGTRLVLLILGTYNYNMGTFCSIELITEFLPTGALVAAYDTDVVPIETVWTLSKPGIIITACIFYFITTFYMGNEIVEIYRSGFKNYYKNIWNYFDWGMILSSYISLCLSITHIFLVQRFFETYKGNQFASINSIASNHDLYIGAVAICTFQMWIRIFRFLSFNQTMTRFNMVLKRCLPEILGFGLILLVCFVIFALIGLLAFGDEHPDFFNFSYAFFFMFRLMMRDFDYEYFEEVDRIWGPVYFMSYVIVVVFVLVNMFLAIISLNYTEVKESEVASTSALREVLHRFNMYIQKYLKKITAKLTIKKSKLLKSEAAKEDTVKETESIKLESSDKIDEEEAFKEFFGVKSAMSKSSLATTTSSYKSFDDEQVPDESETKRDAAIADLMTRFTKRIEELETSFRKINENLDNFHSKIEIQRRKSQI